LLRRPSFGSVHTLPQADVRWGGAFDDTAKEAMPKPALKNKSDLYTGNPMWTLSYGMTRCKEKCIFDLGT